MKSNTKTSLQAGSFEALVAFSAATTGSASRP